MSSWRNAARLTCDSNAAGLNHTRGDTAGSNAVAETTRLWRLVQYTLFFNVQHIHHLQHTQIEMYAIVYAACAV